MDEFLDRELAAAEIDRVRAHLETCAACAAEYRYEDAVLRAVKSKLRRVALPPEVRRRLLAVIRGS